MKKEKLLVFGVLLLAMTGVMADEKTKSFDLTKVEVYRSPSCGCCSKWIKHLEENGFVVDDFVTEDMDGIKSKYGVTSDVASCHTALVGGYVVEGHVPAIDIRKLLKIKPVATGISVPGMPAGTPGMEVGRVDPYNVVLFSEKQKKRIFSKYGK